MDLYTCKSFTKKLLLDLLRLHVLAYCELPLRWQLHLAEP